MAKSKNGSNRYTEPSKKHNPRARASPILLVPAPVEVVLDPTTVNLLLPTAPFPEPPLVDVINPEPMVIDPKDQLLQLLEPPMFEKVQYFKVQYLDTIKTNKKKYGKDILLGGKRQNGKRYLTLECSHISCS